MEVVVMDSAAATIFLHASCLFTTKSSPSTTSDCYFRIHFFRNSSCSRSLALKTKARVAGEIANHQISNHDSTECISSNEMVTDGNNHARKSDGEARDSERMNEICDKLIKVFMVEKPTPTDWRRLLAFSREWVNLRSEFYRRCQEKADTENDPGMKLQLLRLRRKLKEVDEDVQKHNELFCLVKESPSELYEIVSKRRKHFTKEFFVHLYTVSQSYHDNPAEQNDLKELIRRCLAAVQAHDAASQTTEALKSAELKLQDIMNSPSVDAACKKIDAMSNRNELDPALFLLIQKAWSAAKETSIVKDDAKEIMHHLYVNAVANVQRDMPKEVRILKYLLSIRDLDELRCALNDSFTPGVEVKGDEVDMLCTTPELLHSLMKLLMDAYNYSKSATIMREARDLMKPEIVERIDNIRKMVEKYFM